MSPVSPVFHIVVTVRWSQKATPRMIESGREQLHATRGEVEAGVPNQWLLLFLTLLQYN